MDKRSNKEIDEMAKKRKKEKPMGCRIGSLKPRELSSYITKQSWPKKLYTDPIALSESYTDPYVIRNLNYITSGP